MRLDSFSSLTILIIDCTDAPRAQQEPPCRAKTVKAQKQHADLNTQTRAEHGGEGTKRGMHRAVGYKCADHLNPFSKDLTTRQMVFEVFAATHS